MGHVLTILHDFHGSGMHPGPSETGIWHSDLSGNTHKVPELFSGTTIFRKLAFRPGKTTTFEGIKFERCARGFWKVGLPSTAPAHKKRGPKTERFFNERT